MILYQVCSRYAFRWTIFLKMTPNVSGCVIAETRLRAENGAVLVMTHYSSQLLINIEAYVNDYVM